MLHVTEQRKIRTVNFNFIWEILRVVGVYLVSYVVIGVTSCSGPYKLETKHTITAENL